MNLTELDIAKIANERRLLYKCIFLGVIVRYEKLGNTTPERCHRQNYDDDDLVQAST